MAFVGKETLGQTLRDACQHIPQLLRLPRITIASFGMFVLEMCRSSLDPILEPYARNELGMKEKSSKSVALWWLGSSLIYMILVPLIGYGLKRYQVIPF